MYLSQHYIDHNYSFIYNIHHYSNLFLNQIPKNLLFKIIVSMKMCEYRTCLNEAVGFEILQQCGHIFCIDCIAHCVHQHIKQVAFDIPTMVKCPVCGVALWTLTRLKNTESF